MAIDYIITSALNLSQDQVQSLSTARNHGTLNIYLLLIKKQLSIGNVDGISVVTVIVLLVKTISLPLMVCTPPSLWSIKS